MTSQHDKPKRWRPWKFGASSKQDKLGGVCLAVISVCGLVLVWTLTGTVNNILGWFFFGGFAFGIGTLVLLSKWGRYKLRRWRPWQFSLRALLIVTSVLAVVAAFYPTEERRRASILRALRENAASVSGDNVIHSLGLQGRVAASSVDIRDDGNRSWFQFDCDCQLFVISPTHYSIIEEQPELDITLRTWIGPRRVEYSLSDGFQEPKDDRIPGYQQQFFAYVRDFRALDDPDPMLTALQFDPTELPHDIADDLDLPAGSTFADGVAQINGTWVAK